MLVSGGALLGAQAASASVLGSVVQARYLFPDQATVFTDLGASTATTSTSFTFGGIATVSFNNAGVVVTAPSGPKFTTAAFNGIDLTIKSGAPITNAAIDPASSPAFSTGSVLTFTGTDLFLNLSGTCSGCEGGEQIVIDVNSTSPVPEPATFGLLGAGLAVAAARRRSAAA